MSIASHMYERLRRRTSPPSADKQRESLLFLRTIVRLCKMYKMRCVHNVQRARVSLMCYCVGDDCGGGGHYGNGLAGTNRYLYG